MKIDLKPFVTWSEVLSPVVEHGGRLRDLEAGVAGPTLNKGVFLKFLFDDDWHDWQTSWTIYLSWPLYHCLTMKGWCLIEGSGWQTWTDFLMEGVRLVKQRVPQELPPGWKTGVSSELPPGRKAGNSLELLPSRNTRDISELPLGWKTGYNSDLPPGRKTGENSDLPPGSHIWYNSELPPCRTTGYILKISPGRKTGYSYNLPPWRKR